jgi:hypothetical protein
MCVRHSRPAEGATVTLAREPGEPADSGTAVDLTDALLEVRAARERLRRVDSLPAALLAEIGRRLPQNAKGLTVCSGQVPDSRVQLIKDNINADFSFIAS